MGILDFARNWMHAVKLYDCEGEFIKGVAPCRNYPFDSGSCQYCTRLKEEFWSDTVESIDEGDPIETNIHLCITKAQALRLDLERICNNECRY